MDVHPLHQDGEEMGIYMGVHYTGVFTVNERCKDGQTECTLYMEGCMVGFMETCSGIYYLCVEYRWRMSENMYVYDLNVSHECMGW